MTLEDFVIRAQFLFNETGHAQYVCNNDKGHIYVTDSPKYIEHIIRIVNS